MSIDVNKIVKNAALTVVIAGCGVGIYWSLFDGKNPRLPLPYQTLAILASVAVLAGVAMDIGFIQFIFKGASGVAIGLANTVVTVVTTIRSGKITTTTTTTTAIPEASAPRQTIIQKDAMGTGMMKAVPPPAKEGDA